MDGGPIGPALHYSNWGGFGRYWHHHSSSPRFESHWDFQGELQSRYVAERGFQRRPADIFDSPRCDRSRRRTAISYRHLVDQLNAGGWQPRTQYAPGTELP